LEIYNEQNIILTDNLASPYLFNFLTPISQQIIKVPLSSEEEIKTPKETPARSYTFDEMVDFSDTSTAVNIQVNPLAVVETQVMVDSPVKDVKKFLEVISSRRKIIRHPIQELFINFKQWVHYSTSHPYEKINFTINFKRTKKGIFGQKNRDYFEDKYLDDDLSDDEINVKMEAKERAHCSKKFIAAEAADPRKAPTWAAMVVILNCLIDGKEQSNERKRKTLQIFNKYLQDDGRIRKVNREKVKYQKYQEQLKFITDLEVVDELDGGFKITQSKLTTIPKWNDPKLKAKIIEPYTPPIDQRNFVAYINQNLEVANNIFLFDRPPSEKVICSLKATTGNAELELKKFTERSIWITHEMEKLKLTKVAKSYVKYWSKISADEVGIILKIPLVLYKKSLKFQEVRRIIKKIIWKTALYVIKNRSVLGFEFVCSK
jgi:hypothetical protein